MDVYLATLGCRLNEAELQRWSHGFRARGHRVVGRVDDAQVVVLNTCAVTGPAGRSSRQLARQLTRRNPDARVVLTGCYAELQPGALPGVDAVVSNADKDRLVQIVEDELAHRLPPPSPAPAPAVGRTRAFVKVQDGCRNRCTFCIVTVARGDERCRSVDDVVEEVQRRCAEGVREVVLTGVHLGGYEHEGAGLAQLVGAVLHSTDVPRLRFGSVEPWTVTDELLALFADRRLCPHLHLPLQSGCDAVLRRMARRGTVEGFRDLAARARGVEGMNLTTDLIVGFPGEDAAAFERSCALVRELRFGHVHVFPYSARVGTAAARMGRQVPSKVRQERSRALQAIAAEVRADWLSEQLGQVRPVLWEGAGEAAEGGHRFLGYTDHYARCAVVAPPELARTVASAELLRVVEGTRVEVRLTA